MTSTINAGRVELDIVAIARDQVSATLREANKSLSATKAQMDSLRPSVAAETAALEQQNAALVRIGQTSGLYQENAKKLITIGTERVSQLQRELAAMVDMGAAEGPLAKAHQAEIAALQAKATALQQSTAATTAATTGMAQAESAGLGLAGGLSKVWSGARMLVNVLPGLGMAGLVGGVYEGFSALFDLIAGNDDTIPGFVDDVKAAASAQYALTKQISDLATDAATATANVDALRVATLNLGAANAEATGDEKRAAELRRQAGITGIVGDVAETQKALDDLEKIQDSSLKKRAEAEARAKQLAAESNRAQFEFFEAGRAGDTKRQGLAAAAVVEANIARGLAENDMAEAERVFKETGEKIRARNEMIRTQRESLRQAESQGIGDIVGDPMTIMPKGPGDGGDGGGGSERDLVAEWKARMDRLPAPERSAAAVRAEENRLMRRLDRWAGGEGQAMQDHERQVKELVSDYQRWASAIGGLSGPLGQLDGSLGKVASTLSKALGTAASFTAGDWLGGITGIVGAIAGLFSDTHRKVRGIVRDVDRDMTSRGPSTIIINMAPGSDPQAAARATRQVLYSSRGTGADARAPGL